MRSKRIKGIGIMKKEIQEFATLGCPLKQTTLYKNSNLSSGRIYQNSNNQ